MSSHVRQILIAGAGTAAWWNAGDEAIFVAMIQQLKTRFPGAEIGVVSANPAGALVGYQVREIPFKNITEIIEFARQSDLLILGGGGLFYDHWGFSIDKMLTPDHVGVGIYVGFSLLSTLLNKPLMLYSVGVGPLISDEAKHYTRLAFEQAHAITVRDNESKDLLVSLGIAAKKIQVTADPVWNFPDISTDVAKDLIQQIDAHLSSPVLGVAVRPWNNPGNAEWEIEVARALDAFIEREHGTVLFIPFHKDAGSESVDDYIQSQKIRGLMKHADSAHIFSANIGLEKKISILRHCDVVLGMRLHANILAMRYGIPAVGLAYDPKVTNLFAGVEQKKYVLDMRKLNAKLLTAKLQKAWGDAGDLQKFYSKKAVFMSRSVMKNSAILEKLAQAYQPLPSPLPVNADHLIRSLFIENSLGSLKQIDALNQEILEQRKEILEQHGKMVTLNNELISRHEQINHLNSYIYALQNTSSWKITRPLRFAGRFLQNPRNGILELSEYWKVSRPLRFLKRLVKSPRQGFVELTSYLYGRFASFRNKSNVLKKMWRITSDLTWDEFQSKVLSQRKQYKGVYVVYPAVDWNIPLAQRPKPLVSALAKSGYLVIYRTPNHIDRVHGFREMFPNVWVTDQDVDIDHAVYSIYSTSYNVDLDMLKNKHQSGRLLIYEYIDHISPLINGSNRAVNHLEQLKRFFFEGGADYVVASARQLEKEAADSLGDDKVIYIPNGVDIEHYRNSTRSDVKVPDRFINFRRRHKIIVGYFGAIAPWLWYEMIEQLVLSRPDVGFVFIGPDYHESARRLPQSENMLYLGAVNYEVLPAYAGLFDVCLIPFAPGEIAHTTSPLKLFEYFALEKPVVTTSFMDECVAFGEVFSGHDAQTISASLDSAIKVKDDSGYKARLALLAERNSWDERAKEYRGILDKVEQDFLLETTTSKLAQYPVVNLVVHTFFDFDGNNMFFGGAERYLIELVRLVQMLGYKVNVYQSANSNWVRYYHDIRVMGLDTKGNHLTLNHKFHQFVPDGSLTIYFAFFLASPLAHRPPSIGISHGIYWDDVNMQTVSHRALVDNILKSIVNVTSLVSVDTNTINWLRATRWELGDRCLYIPNFVDLDQFRASGDNRKNRNEVVILYPRRLYAPRGFWLIEPLVAEFLEKYDNVAFHFVGKADEREEHAVRKLVEAFPDRVKWYFLPPERMHEAYQQADITLIPTMQSEGTSLSCLEAMASGNAVIATNVGGLPNLIFPDYNGLLIEPNVDSLRDALRRLIDEPGLRSRLALQGIEVAKTFDIEKWRSRWKKVLQRYLPARTSVVEEPIVAVFYPTDGAEWHLSSTHRLRLLGEQLADQGVDIYWVQASGRQRSGHERVHLLSPTDDLYLRNPWVIIDGMANSDVLDRYEAPVIICDVTGGFTKREHDNLAASIDYFISGDKLPDVDALSVYHIPDADALIRLIRSDNIE